MPGPWASWSEVRFVGYPNTFGFEDQAAYPEDGFYPDQESNPVSNQDSLVPYDQARNGYAMAPAPDQRVPYTPYPAPPPNSPQPSIAPAPEPQPEEALTLIFKDGRPPMQIHNYMLTRATLYVRDQRHSEISLDELDLPATKKVNKQAGVDFQPLPETSH